jgi:hypothetical protein
MSTKNRRARKGGATSISKIGQRRQVVIPRAVCDDVGLDVLTLEEVKRVRKGEQQLRKGQSRSWKKIEDELGL